MTEARLWVNVPSGLVGAKFERKNEPTQQEIDMLVKEAENKKADEARYTVIIWLTTF